MWFVVGEGSAKSYGPAAKVRFSDCDLLVYLKNIATRGNTNVVRKIKWVELVDWVLRERRDVLVIGTGLGAEY